MQIGLGVVEWGTLLLCLESMPRKVNVSPERCSSILCKVYIIHSYHTRHFHTKLPTKMAFLRINLFMMTHSFHDFFIYLIYIKRPYQMILSTHDQNGYRCRYIFGWSLLLIRCVLFMCNIKLQSAQERTLYIRNIVVTCCGVTKRNLLAKDGVMLSWTGSPCTVNLQRQNYVAMSRQFSVNLFCTCTLCCKRNKLPSRIMKYVCWSLCRVPC